MAVNKARAQHGGNQSVYLQLLVSGAIPSIAGVVPLAAADDVSVADGGPGLSTITIKNFRGNRGFTNIQLTPHTSGIVCAATTVTYSGDDLSFVVDSKSDAGVATDNVNVDVRVEVY